MKKNYKQLSVRWMIYGMHLVALIQWLMKWPMTW